MRKRKQLLSYLLISVLVLALLAGCTTTGTDAPDGGKNAEKAGEGQKTGEKAEEKGAGKEKVLLLNNGQEPKSFDPPVAFDAVSYNALNNIMEGLVRLDKDNEPKEAMAEKIDVSDDGKVYTFTLRDNAKWSNGDPVTAHDFEYAWKRLADPKTASEAAFLSYYIEGAEAFNSGKGKADDMKVTAKDDKTLEVTLAAPQGYFLHVITNPPFFPINQKVAEENAKWHREAKTFVGNGPFKLTEWKHDSELVMEKNENYWDADTVKLDRVVWKMIDEVATEYELYNTGELHTSELPPDMSEQLYAEGKVNVEPEAGTEFYRFNTTMKPFDNKNIRKAFSLAIDRQNLTDYVLKTGEKPAAAFVSYGFQDAAGGDFREVGGDYVKFDPDEAKKLLEKGMKEEGYDKLPEITLTYNTHDKHKKNAEALQQMFKETLGVDVKLVNVEWQVLSDDQSALKLQFSRSSFLADFADPINYLESFVTGSTMNRTGWSNKTFDELIKKAKQEADEKKRFELMHEAEQILFDDAVITPLYFYSRVYLQNEKVKDIVRHPVGYMELKWADIEQ
ncbi:peptide ABC transporter substrate-binding protein [Numidum massiliense]|uniref:peptide ABC transporter substrate-binding protein n=1 Tax=Numidum massiliense TaxID=1522315 RepID=UPI0006D5A45F|nr:peptide ABC transporter substrate-binding protein [Numidum massiliense]